jgi:hypothetical protein
MPSIAVLLGIALVLAALIDAFEVVLLPRPARRHRRLNRYFYRGTWALWSRLAARLPPGRRREDFVGVFGPLSMVLLFVLWAACLLLGFGLLHWGLQFTATGGPYQSLGREVILSGDAFFTLGYGDVVPRGALARVLVILESGTGFGFIALTVGYLPVLYQHFARRDVQLIEFAARAGSPPTALSLLHWHASQGDRQQLDAWLRDWEHWAGELVESHSTYPMLAFYRSQHDGHSWLASLATVLDACTLVIAGSEGTKTLQAAATFSAARRVLDEICNSLVVASLYPDSGDRLSSPSFDTIAAVLSRELPGWEQSADTTKQVARLRGAYEPQLAGLSAYLLLPLPRWADDIDELAYRFDPQRVVDRLVRDRPDAGPPGAA